VIKKIQFLSDRDEFFFAVSIIGSSKQIFFQKGISAILFSSEMADEDNEGAVTTDVNNAVLAGPTVVPVAALCDPALVLPRKVLPRKVPLLSLMDEKSRS
jgi:hypothetical protein